MSAADLAAVVVVIVATVAATMAVYAAWRLLAASRRLEATAAELDAAAGELLAELEGLAVEARRSLGRAEDQLERAGQVVDTIEHASRATYRTVASPVIKAAAVATGVKRGAGRLRQGPDADPSPPGGGARPPRPAPTAAVDAGTDRPRLRLRRGVRR
ncbi:MAG: hypothetical protein AB7W59_24040 [Acidimicrobiia bacterium]